MNTQAVQTPFEVADYAADYALSVPRARGGNLPAGTGIVLAVLLGSLFWMSVFFALVVL